MDEAERCDELLLMRDGPARSPSDDAGRSCSRQTGTDDLEEAFLALVGVAA